MFRDNELSSIFHFKYTNILSKVHVYTEHLTVYDLNSEWECFCMVQKMYSTDKKHEKKLMPVILLF